MVSPAKLEGLLMSEPEIAQAVVAGEGQPGIVALLDEQGIDAREECVLRRVVGADGRSRAFCNDAPVSVQFLKALGEPAENFPMEKGTFAEQVVARVDLKKALTEALKASTVK